MNTVAKIRRVVAMPNQTLRVVFTRKGMRNGTRNVRLSGFIARYKGLAALNDPELFRKVKVIDGGAAVGWPGDLDVSATTLLRMAREQMPFEMADFRAWQQRVKLSNQEAADALGVTLSTVKNLRAGSSPVSNAVAIACRAMESEPTILAAHYYPRATGRPKSADLETA